MTRSAYDDYVRVCKSKGLRPSSKESMMVNETDPEPLPVTDDQADRFLSLPNDHKFVITKGQLLKLVEDTRNETLNEVSYDI